MTLAIVLLLVGLALIVLELLFPSFGALGIAAALALLASIVLAFRESHSTGLTFLMSTAVLVPAAILLGMKLLPKSPLGKVLVAQGASFTDAAAVDREAEVIDRLEGVGRGLPIVVPPLPVVAVPTTAGTGAEADDPRRWARMSDTALRIVVGLMPCSAL